MKNAIKILMASVGAMLLLAGCSVYDPIYDLGTITIQYLDAATGGEIQPPTTYGDLPAGDYDYDHPAIAGYAFNAVMSDSGSGKLAAGGKVTIKFYYDKLKQSITVRYLDADTEMELRPSATYPDVPAGPYSYSPPEIEGYTFNAEKSDPGEGTIGEGQNVVIRFYYDEQLPDPVFQSITIRYLDAATEAEIRPATGHGNITAGPYSYTAPDINGYTFNAGRSDSGEGTIAAGENIVIRFYYDKVVPVAPSVQSVTIRYLDAATEAEIRPATVHGNITAGPYSYTAPDINGYAFNAAESDSGSGTIGEGQNVTIRFYYDKIVQSITIRYLITGTDEEIQPSATHSDVPVGAYSYAAPDIDGYAFNATDSDSGTGTIGAGDNVVITFYYDQEVVVKVIHMTETDSGGYELLIETSTVALIGAELAGSSLAYYVPGFEFSHSAPDIFTVSKDNNTITLYYTRETSLRQLFRAAEILLCPPVSKKPACIAGGLLFAVMMRQQGLIPFWPSYNRMIVLNLIIGIGLLVIILQILLVFVL
ncbi:MAG: MucBP domain-containing protein [Rikenellaceae bacterium]|jgi:hypothetical protein|nr:MucBP domain-containing protein [Rikenellaceae bacterium]